MKRDFDLIRKILLEAEAQSHNFQPPIAPANYTTEEIRYHLRIMEEAGLVQFNSTSKPGMHPTRNFGGMTWAGHEFLDSIRETETWEEVKTDLREKRVSMTIDAIKAVVVNLMTGALGG